MTWEAGPKLTYIAPPGTTPAEEAAERDRLAQRFAKAVDVPASVGAAPDMADGFRREAPGSADHARGVMRTLEGAVFLVDADG